MENSWHHKIDRLLTTFFSSLNRDERINRSKMAYIHILTLILLLLFSIATLLNVIYGEKRIYSLEVIVAILMFLQVAFLKFSHNRSSIIGRVIASLFVLILIAIGFKKGNLNTGFLFWCFLYPPVVVYIRGRKEGFIWSALVYALVSYIIHHLILSQTLDVVSAIRFHVSYIFTTCIAYVLDLRREFVEHKQKDLQMRFFHSAKLASIGVLASGVAHELNNPLTSIIGYAQTGLKRASDIDFITNSFSKILNASNRMKNIIMHLKNFSRAPKESDLKKIPIRKPIEESLILLGTTLETKDIHVTFDIPNDDLFIIGDSSQLESVFQNLLTNSKDAFDEVKDDRKKEIKIKVESLENKISIKYSDNAVGIPEKYLAQIFDPFFTTKDPGQGTGLGMSLAFQIIDDHHGKISVESEIDTGSTFTIEFFEALD